MLFKHLLCINNPEETTGWATWGSALIQLSIQAIIFQTSREYGADYKLFLQISPGSQVQKK
jgi:hypothetical protein